MPKVKRHAKTVYQRLSYLRHRPTSKIQIADGWKMQKLGTQADVTFFGYFDKSCWNARGNLIVTHRQNGEYCEICIATENNPAELTCLAQTRSWNWQQGAMLTWAPDDTLFYNTFENRKLVGRRITTDGKVVRNYHLPLQSLSPDGLRYMSLNYNRLRRYRAEYGYTEASANPEFDFDDEADGIWSVDTCTGDSNLVLTLAQMKNALPEAVLETVTAHKINHIIWAPDGQKILFMYRFFQGGKKNSQLYVCNPDGSELVLLANNQVVSHYSWLDKTRVVAWARDKNGRDGYSIYETSKGRDTPLNNGEFDALGDGHPSVSPRGDLLAFDTYPLKDRCRRLYILSPKSGRYEEIARLFSSWKNEGPTRCDLHPRWAPDGRAVSVDSDCSGVRSHYILRNQKGYSI